MTAATSTRRPRTTLDPTIARLLGDLHRAQLDAHAALHHCTVVFVAVRLRHNLRRAP